MPDQPPPKPGRDHPGRIALRRYVGPYSGPVPAKEKIMSDIISLRQMQIGQSGRIATVEALGEMGRRIRDMGLIPGTTVSVVGRAPLKDPVALRLSGVTVTLRNSEADHITVDVSN
jgi:ferrous iron transport protein A